jgi:hypothetical protein
MTLAELMPAVRQLPAVDKLRLIRLLADDLDAGEDIAPLTPYRTYHLPTPYGAIGAARALMDAMKQDDATRG